jgi:plasmid stabilization system protein ParE
MKHRRVVTTPEADADAQGIDEWWVRHRGAASNLFVEELADAIALLGMEAGVGVRFSHSAIPGLRRYLLRSTRYHLYFVYTDDLVVIIAIWGATRGTTPPFGDRAASARRALAASDDLAKKPGS